MASDITLNLTICSLYPPESCSSNPRVGARYTAKGRSATPGRLYWAVSTNLEKKKLCKDVSSQTLRDHQPWKYLFAWKFWTNFFQKQLSARPENFLEDTECQGNRAILDLFLPSWVCMRRVKLLHCLDLRRQLGDQGRLLQGSASLKTSLPSYGCFHRNETQPECKLNARISSWFWDFLGCNITIASTCSEKTAGFSNNSIRDLTSAGAGDSHFCISWLKGVCVSNFPETS